MQNIAILGVGAMGSRLGQNLLAAGYGVAVYNRTPERVQPLVAQGATYAATPKAAASQADVAISMVTDDGASQQVWLEPEGAAAGLRPGAIAIESSTLTVAWTRTLATTLQGRGVQFLDAPVVGSRPQAEAGKLIYLVGGKSAALDAVKDVLQCLGTVHHVGSEGQGMALKLAVNALFGIQVAALAEVLTLLQTAGLGKDSAWEHLKTLPVISPAAAGVGALMLQERHEPLFPIALVEKDFRYAVGTAEAASVAMPVSEAAGRVYRQAVAMGDGGLNITAVGRGS